MIFKKTTLFSAMLVVLHTGDFVGVMRALRDIDIRDTYINGKIESKQTSEQVY